jgi:hypothetical protein
VRITLSASKHDVPEDDMLHALRNTIRKFDVDETTMFIGPARNGALLEIGVLEFETDPTVIHAMPLRPAFHRLL